MPKDFGTVWVSMHIPCYSQSFSIGMSVHTLEKVSRNARARARACAQKHTRVRARQDSHDHMLVNMRACVHEALHVQTYISMRMSCSHHIACVVGRSIRDYGARFDNGDRHSSCRQARFQQQKVYIHKDVALEPVCLHAHTQARLHPICAPMQTCIRTNMHACCRCKDNH